MQSVDKQVPEKWGVDSVLLMENAAQAAAILVHNRLKEHSGKCVIFCGPGNNGGDGMALARILYCDGVDVALCLILTPEKLPADSLKQYKLIQHLGIPCLSPRDALAQTGDILIIDALFGTGLNRPPKDHYAQVINEINRSGQEVISIDIPSGVKGSSGGVFEPAVKAKHTLCLGLPKPGNLLYPGYLHQGHLYHSAISIPPQAFIQSPSTTFCLEFPELPEVNRAAYKGSRGYGLVIGGCSRYRGAPRFSALAFLQTGGGYVHLASIKEVIEAAAVSEPELILHSLEKSPEGFLTRENLPAIQKLLEKKDWVILGPGIGINPESTALVRSLLNQIDQTLILDGDGLTALRDNLHLLKDFPHPLILTPHPGEAAGLLNRSVKEVLEAPMDAAGELAKRCQAWVILKQPHSLLATPEGKIHINLSGSPVLATAGSGDLLNGVIASMLGRDLPPEPACLAAMMIHGLAGELVEQEMGAQGCRIHTIQAMLPRAVEWYQKQYRQLKDTGNNRLRSLRTI